MSTRRARNDLGAGYRSSEHRWHRAVVPSTFRLMRFLGSLSLPAINVWLALLFEDHVHRPAALAWWRADQSEQVAFSRLTQIGVLRLLTTSVAMNGRPLSMADAWTAYDYLFLDDRVVFLPEPPMLENAFRSTASHDQASPKLWADGYVAAFAEVAGAQVVTFDQALAGRCTGSRRLIR